MNILVTNDDGINAEGIFSLAECLSELGDVTVVAPTHEQSAVSSKITIHQPLRVQKLHLSEKFTSYSVSGTPADCVKLAIAELCKEKPDIVVSGINHGSNTGLNLIYSGTVAGAIEGMLNNIPSVAFSITSFDIPNFDLAKETVKKLIPEVLKNGLPHNILLNVNIPAINVGEEAGIKWCKLSQNRYVEDFEKRLDPLGNPYYWLGGKKINIDIVGNFDDVLIKENYITIVPVKYEFNTDDEFKEFQHWNI
jgi:5'-nucleotidase